MPVEDWEVFAVGFSGSPEKTASGRADHRQCGLAQGPDGSLYISDDSKGTIYKVTYNQHQTNNVVPLATASNAPALSPPKKSTGVSKTVKPAAKTAVVTGTLSESIAAGKIVYKQNCLSCHQPDGGGVQNMNPPLVNTSYVLGDKNRLISVVLKGMRRQEIDGQHFSNTMPFFKFLKDKQIADLLTYVRNSFGNKTTAVLPNDVKKARGK